MRILHDRERDPLEIWNLAEEPGYAQLADQMEERLQEWMAQVGDPFDTGARLPVTEMLDLGQAFTASHWYDDAPREYAAAIAKHRSCFRISP